MSMAEERAIAQKYIGGFPTLMVTWGLGGFFLWLALWPLTINGYIPLWAGCLIATIVLCGCYLPTHEAQHGNIGRPGSSLRWLNELVGHLSVFPFMVPYRLHRAIYAVAVVILHAVNIWQGAPWWAFWPTLVWGVPFCIHYFLYKSLTVDEAWADERIDSVKRAS